MSLGLEGALGANEFQKALRQQILDQEAQKQQAFQNSLLARTADRADRQQQILESEHADTLKERSLATNEKIAGDTAANLSPNAIVSPDVGRRFAGTSLAPLLKPDATLPSTQLSAGVPMVGADTASTAPAITDKPSVLTGQLRFTGTPKQVADENKKALVGRLMMSLPTNSPERRSLEYEQATGVNPPAGAFDPKPPTVTDANYMLGDKPIIGLKNAQGRIFYQGKDVTDQVQPYVTPKQGDTVDQDKLEQQYRTVLARGLSSRSGGLGLEDSKVQQANHLIALMDQNYDTRTGEYTIPAVLQSELALGLARLTSPGGQVGEGMMHEMNQRTAKGDLAGVYTYLTGTPVTGNTQAVFKMFKDSIERQGQVAEQNREGEMRYLRGLAPTELEESRRQSLEANSLNPLRRSRVIQNQQTGERKIQTSIDSGKTWQ